MTQGKDWSSFENSFKTEVRSFNRTAANQLALIFDGIGQLQTRAGRPLVVDAGPDTDFHILYRARVFLSDDKLKTALGRPDIHFGPPPPALAATGSMSTRGVSVLHGSSNQDAAIAEARPPVGSRVAVAQFEIIRHLRLLDLTALRDVRVTGSLADFGLAGRLESAVFLRSLGGHIARPAMADDEPHGYFVTQAIVDFLATGASVPIDGIIFPSVQAAGDVFSVILFHGAARVEPMNIPEGTEISASTGRWTEYGWVEEYEVFENAPLVSGKFDSSEHDPDFDAITEATPLAPQVANWRDDSLRIVPASVRVHRVKRVEFATDEFTVKRHHRDEQDSFNF